MKENKSIGNGERNTYTEKLILQDFNLVLMKVLKELCHQCLVFQFTRLEDILQTKET